MAKVKDSYTRTGQKIEIRANGTKRIYIENKEPDMAQQQYKDQCDVNKIMEKHDKGYAITHIAKNPGRYAELGEPQDLLEAKMRVIKAESAFMDLPAKLREKCNHDPANFLKMLQDGSNDEELINLGIKLPKKSDAVTTAPKASESAPVSEAKK